MKFAVAALCATSVFAMEKSLIQQSNGATAYTAIAPDKDAAVYTDYYFKGYYGCVADDEGMMSLVMTQEAHGPAPTAQLWHSWVSI